MLLAKHSFHHQGKFVDKVLSRFSIFIFSVPSFVVGLILVYFFSVKLNLLPTSGLTSIYADEMNFWESLFDNLIHLILPLITLSIAGTAIFYKYLRDNLISVSNQAFVLNLKASGFTEKEIYEKHILPNSIQPLISIVGIEFGLLLGGALITEVIFALPGMGRLTINAIMNRDYPLVIGCTLVAGFMVIITNLIADFIKIKMDKRLIKDLIK
jgi:peptide/nickel transport system permease protein